MSVTVATPGRSLARNSAAQVVGRLFLSGGRLGVAVVIARVGGAPRFGEYALLLGVIAIFEWLADFGQTDIAVRQICAEPASEDAVLAGLARLKLISSGLLAVAMPLVLVALGYSSAIVWGGVIGGVSILAYSLLQTDRAILKAGMRSDVDIGAEAIGLLVMLPATALAAYSGGSPAALIAAYALSRIVHATLLHRYARGVHHSMPAPRQAATALFRAAAPLGLAGLMVALYDGLAPIMLSKLMSFADVAKYGAAARFALPVLALVQAVTGAFFPVLARQIGDGPAIGEIQAAALWLSLLVGAGLAVGLYGGADFLVGLFAGKIAGSGQVLRWMCALVVARAFTMTMTPLVVIGGRQQLGLWLTLVSLVAQALAIPLLVPAFGVLGVVIGYLVIEVVIGVGPISWLAVAATGARIDWSVPARILAAAAAAAMLSDRLPIAGSFGSGVAAGCMFVGLVTMTGAASPARLRAVAAVMRQRGPA